MGLRYNSQIGDISFEDQIEGLLPITTAGKQLLTDHSLLNDIFDVNVGDSPQDNNVLTYDAQSGYWVARTVATTLEGLGDTNIVNTQEGQLLIFDGTRWVNSDIVAGDKTFAGNVTIGGNLVIQGDILETQTESVLVENNEIVLNYNEPGSGVTAGYAGIRVDRGGSTGYPDYLFVFDEQSDTFRIGEDGDLQAVATRNDTMDDGGITFWSGASHRLETTGNLVWADDTLSVNGDIDLNSNKVINVVDPTDPQDVATKAYVDAQIGGASTSLAELTDTELDSLTDGDFLVYSASTDKWVNSGIDDLGLASEADLQAHIDDTGNPHNTNVANLTDTNVGSIANGHLLVYDSATSTWVATDVITGAKTFEDAVQVNGGLVVDGSLTVSDGTAAALEVVGNIIEITGTLRYQSVQSNALLTVDDQGNIISSNIVATEAENAAPLNMPILSNDPTELEDGDLWMLESNGIFWNVRVDGATYRVAMTPTGYYDLGQLNDVNVDQPSDGDILSYDNASSTWIGVPRTGLGLVSQGDFDDHVNNVDIHFEKSDIQLNDLGNVNVATPQDGAVLTYNSGTWVAEVISSSVQDGTADGQMLYWNDTASEWQVANNLHWDNDQTRFGIGITPDHALHVSGTSRLEGDVTITGNLTVVGESYQTHVEELYVENNEIIVNQGEPGDGVTAGYAGIRVYRGGSSGYPDYLFVFEENTKTFRIGEDGDLQAVATREDNPQVNGLAFWNDENNRFDTNIALTWDGSVLSISGTADLNNNRITNVVDPTDPQDAATKAYVDAQIGGAATSLAELTDTDISETIVDGAVLRYSATEDKWVDALLIEGQDANNRPVDAILVATTTNNSPTELLIDGSNRIALPTAGITNLKIMVSATDFSGYYAAWSFDLAIASSGGVGEILEQAKTIIFNGTDGSTVEWDVQFGVNGNDLTITATGDSSTVQWTARVTGVVASN